MATELKMNGVNWALRAAAIVGVMYGIGFLLMPSAMFQLSGDPGVPTNPGWVVGLGGLFLVLLWALGSHRKAG
jgi:hypothetical protein